MSIVHIRVRTSWWRTGRCAGRCTWSACSGGRWSRAGRCRCAAPPSLWAAAPGPPAGPARAGRPIATSSSASRGALRSESHATGNARAHSECSFLTLATTRSKLWEMHTPGGSQSSARRYSGRCAAPIRAAGARALRPSGPARAERCARKLELRGNASA